MPWRLDLCGITKKVNLVSTAQTSSVSVELREVIALSKSEGKCLSSMLDSAINSRSSTETKFVGADDFMPAICWTRYFLAAQKYHVRDIFFSKTTRAPFFWEKKQIFRQQENKAHQH
jgi:hypothetical protein